MEPVEASFFKLILHLMPSTGPKCRKAPLAASDHLEFVLTRDLLASRGLSLVSNFLSYMGSLSQIFNIFIFVILSYVRVCLSVGTSYFGDLGTIV